MKEGEGFPQEPDTSSVTVDFLNLLLAERENTNSEQPCMRGAGLSIYTWLQPVVFRNHIHFFESLWSWRSVFFFVSNLASGTTSLNVRSQCYSEIKFDGSYLVKVVILLWTIMCCVYFTLFGNWLSLSGKLGRMDLLVFNWLIRPKSSKVKLPTYWTLNISHL